MNTALTLAEQILSYKAAKTVLADEIVVVEVDQVMIVDSIAPDVIRIINEDLGGEIKFPEKISIVIDHVSPASNIEVAKAQKQAREFAQKHAIKLFDVGRGICHQLLIEEKRAKPGEIILGSDSHSTTYGAVSAFGTGMGASDIAMAASSGKTWLKVPKTVKVNFLGKKKKNVYAKDIALEMIRQLTADGATYASIEYHGLEDFSLSERMTMANLAVEAGAKVGLIPVSGLLLNDYNVPDWLFVDKDANYFKEIEIDISKIESVVAAPSFVDNVQTVKSIQNKKVDQVFVGSCTNGRLDDLHIVADILKNKKVAEGTRLLVIPASSKVLEEAVADGTFASLLASGAIFATPGCGPCMGRHMGILAPDEVCVSTTNRNFIGRMGSAQSEVFLASPATAAYTALRGFISGGENA